MTLGQKIRMLAVAGLLPVAACTTPPPPPPMPAPAPMSGLSTQDQDFVNTAAMVNLFEVQSSRLAVEKSRDARVRSYAQRMLDDHTEATQQLQALSARKGFTVPAALAPDMEQKMQQLRDFKFSRFNRTYIADQRDGHNQAVAAYQAEIANGMDPDVKAFAQQWLPRLQAHDQMAARLR